MSSKILGIVTGSGPEAGIDFWSKFLHWNKLHHGEGFRGDIDVPQTVIYSVPTLGYSMDMAQHEDRVWAALYETIDRIAEQVDCFVITCNTLHYYEDRIREAFPTAHFHSMKQVLYTHAQENELERCALLGSSTVMDHQGTYSPYAALHTYTQVEELNAEFHNTLHQLIYDIKQHGVSPTLNETFRRMLDQIAARHIYLACTELPLLHTDYPDKECIDLTSLLAKRSVELLYKGERRSQKSEDRSKK